MKQTRSTEHRLLPFVFVLLAPALGSAQDPASAGALPPPQAPATVSTTETSTAALPPETPPVVTPARPAANDPSPAPATTAAPIATTAPASESAPVPVRAYGILWASAFATQPVQSYNLATTNAPTAAVNPAIYGRPHDFLLSYQVQQTRAGMVVGEGSPVKGTLEIDFIHFDQSSPFAQAFPRIRIGLIEWQAREHHKFFMGQTWDIFGNTSAGSLLSHSFNLVGTLFQAGNIGFMRPQLGYSGLFGNVELTLATGMATNNLTSSFNDAEDQGIPSGSARLAYHVPDSKSMLGVSGIATSLRFSSPTTGNPQRRIAGGGQLFADLSFAKLNLHGEAYVAQNMANTGALNLSQARYGYDVQDAGGYLSGKLTLGAHALTAMGGAAAVLNPSDLVPGYKPADATTNSPLTPNSGGPGMRYNASAHVGYWYSPYKGLSIVLEPYLFMTKYKLAAADVNRVHAVSTAYGVQFGSMYQF